MIYNIHPIFVHFPIAFLFIYSVIKILPLKKWFPRIAWKDIERLLLVVGILGAFAALSTGELAEQFFSQKQQLVEMHAMFASFATWTYVLLLAGEIAVIINTAPIVVRNQNIATRILRLVEKVFYNHNFSTLLAIVGFFAIAITGLLGGVITYGVSADPIAPTVLKILGITY